MSWINNRYPRMQLGFMSAGHETKNIDTCAESASPVAAIQSLTASRLTQDVDDNASALQHKVAVHVQAIQQLLIPSPNGATDAQIDVAKTVVEEQMIQITSQIHDSVLQTACKTNRKLEKRQNQLTHRLKQAASHSVELEAETSMLQGRLEASQQMLNDRDAQLAEMAQTIHKLERDLLSHHAADGQINHCIEKQKKQIATLTAELDQLQREHWLLLDWQDQVMELADGNRDHSAARQRRHAISEADSFSYADTDDDSQTVTDVDSLEHTTAGTPALSNMSRKHIYQQATGPGSSFDSPITVCDQDEHLSNSDDDGEPCLSLLGFEPRYLREFSPPRSRGPRNYMDVKEPFILQNW